MNTVPLRVSAVSKSLNFRRVLDNLTLDVPRGQIVGLLGRNGSGKTTLIECALGLRGIDAGEVQVFGDSAQSLSSVTRAKIGYVPQQCDLFEWMTVEQMLSYFKAFYPRWNDDKVSSLLDRWSIQPMRLIGELSGGEKQRLAIIRALAHDPELLILDEPVASLDPAGRRDFLRELVDTTIERNTTVLFSTHILSDLERVAVNLAILKDGAIQMQDALDSIAESVVRIHGDEQALLSVPSSMVIGKIACAARGAAVGTSPYLIARLDASERMILAENKQLSIDALSLEDLFIEVTK